MKLSARGFTLIELLVVISIIAILAVIGMVLFSNIQKAARDSRRKADIDAISKAYEVHYDGSYQPLQAGYFSGGNIPTPPEGGNYTGLLSESEPSFRVCAALENHPLETCNTPSSTCFCKSSSQFSYAAGAGGGGGGLDHPASCDTYGTLDDGLVGYWRMDDDSWGGNPNEVADSSGNNNNGTALNGASIISGQSGFGTAGSFDGIYNGSNDYLNLGNQASLNLTNALSVTFWFKKTATGWGGGRFPISKNVGTTNGWAIAQEWYGNNPLSFRIYAGDYRAGEIDTELDTWMHFVGTYNSATGEVKLYKNGGQVVKTGNAPVGTTITSSPANLLIGRSSETSPMEMDDVRIYNRALSPDEISSLWNGGLGCIP